MKIDGGSFSFSRPLNAFGRTSTSLFATSTSFGSGNAFQPSNGPSVWNAIQRIQTILLERQDKSAAAGNSGADLYAERKSISGDAVNGAKIAGKFLDVKAVSMQYVDSDATDTRFTAKSVLSSSFDGDRTTLTADRVQNTTIGGDKSTVNVKTLTSGQIKGDGVTVNAQTIDGVVSVTGSGTTINADKVAFAQLNGQGTKLKTETLGVVTIAADNIAIEAEKAGSIALRGGTNSVLVDTATNVRGGTGADRITVETAAYVSGGKGNDTLTLGSGVREVRFNAGDGQDTINASAGARIAFGSGIARDDVIVAREGSTVRLTFRNSTDAITLKTATGATSKLTFADGSTLAL